MASAKTASATAYGAWSGEAGRQCRSMRPRSLVAPNGTQKARPENLVVAATAIAEASPFPRHRTKTPRECPGGRRGRPKRSGHRDSGRAGRPKEAGGRCPGRCPRANAPKSDRRRAKTPINRRKSRLRRRAAPKGEACRSQATDERSRSPEPMFHFVRNRRSTSRNPCSTSRNRCSTSSESMFPLRPESAFHFVRNTHGAGVKAVSPAERGRSAATRLDAGEHTQKLLV